MKRIVLTDRDNKIISFLQLYKCATTSSIAKIFFNSSKRPCSRRLKYLREHGFINSSQEFVSLEQIHYVNKKPSQLRHSTILTNLIAKLHEQNIEILKDKVEFKVGNLRSDALIVLRKNNKIYTYFIEVCNTKKFDNKKYIDLYKSNEWKKIFPVFPNIIVISDKSVDKTNLNTLVFKLDLSDFNI